MTGKGLPQSHILTSSHTWTNIEGIYVKVQKGRQRDVLNVWSHNKLSMMCRRAKAAFEAYQEREMPLVRQDKPGLKQSQYKEMIWKTWQKAPENPLNKARQ